MTWEVCTSGAAIHKAGENADATIIASGSALADYYDEAIAFACVAARKDVQTNFSSLTNPGRKLIQEIVTCHIAQQIIKWNMGVYTSRGEATTMLNILESSIQRNVALLKDDNHKTYLGIT